MLNSEVWVPIKEYAELYEVSNLGRIRSLDKTVKQFNGHTIIDRFWKGRILKASMQEGYCVVCLYRDTVKIQRKVHQLVAEAFLKKETSDQVVRHLNDVKTDNKLANLSYGTVQENVNDKFRNGYKNARRKLSKAGVFDILGSDLSSAILGTMFGVSQSTIQDLKAGKFYKSEYKEFYEANKK